MQFHCAVQASKKNEAHIYLRDKEIACLSFKAISYNTLLSSLEVWNLILGRFVLYWKEHNYFAAAMHSPFIWTVPINQYHHI